jgi:hypothetical protein
MHDLGLCLYQWYWMKGIPMVHYLLNSWTYLTKMLYFPTTIFTNYLGCFGAPHVGRRPSLAARYFQRSIITWSTRSEVKAKTYHLFHWWIWKVVKVGCLSSQSPPHTLPSIFLLQLLSCTSWYSSRIEQIR